MLECDLKNVLEYYTKAMATEFDNYENLMYYFGIGAKVFVKDYCKKENLKYKRVETIRGYKYPVIFVEKEDGTEEAYLIEALINDVYANFESDYNIEPTQSNELIKKICLYCEFNTSPLKIARVRIYGQERPFCDNKIEINGKYLYCGNIETREIDSVDWYR